MYRILLLSALISSIRPLKVLQITDFHLDMDYSITGDTTKKCHDLSAEKLRESGASSTNLGKYGDYKCDSPELLVNYIVSEAQRLVPKPDLILWTGDNTPHIDEYDMDYVFKTLSKTTAYLFAAYPNIPILPTFGNHDYAPSNGFVEESSLYSQVYDKLWGANVGADSHEIFLQGGYYKYEISAAESRSAQVILVLNTNLYYNQNQAAVNFSDPLDPGAQFKYMQDTLDEARKCSQLKTNQRFNQLAAKCASVVHIVAHIGPGAFERTPNITWFTPYYNDRFLSIIESYSANIGWMIFGHHHTDTFHVVRDYQGTPINVAWMGPAVTPWFSTLDGAGSNNPAFRVYETDDKTGEILDFTTYSLNLDKLNRNENESAVVEYSMKNAYSLGSLKPSEISGLVERFAKNDDLFSKYIRYNSAGWEAKMPQGQFRKAQLCSLRFSDYQRYYECMETKDPTKIAQIHFLGPSIMVILVLNLVF